MPTGYNDHYMYLNQGQQTIPNGLVRAGRAGLGLTGGTQLTPGLHRGRAPQLPGAPVRS